MGRVFLAALTAGLVLGLAGPARADETKAILDKAIKAHGGPEKLTKLKAGRAKGKGTLTILGMDIPIEYEALYDVPGKFKEGLTLEIAGQKISQVIVAKGDKVTLTVNGQEMKLPDNIKDEMKEATHGLEVSQLIGLRDKKYELSNLGEIKIEDKPAVGFKVKTKGRRDIDLYFDKATGLLARTDRRAIDPMSGQEVAEERVWKDYQKVDGIPTPKKLIVNRDGKKFLELEFSEVKLLESVDDSEFNP